MTKKEYKPKYQPQPEDMNATGSLNRQKFVARIVNTEDKALTAKEVHALINHQVKVNRGRTHINTQANLADAVRTGRLDKTRILIEPRTDDDPKGYRGKTRVVYHPTNMKPMGLDIPVPSYTKQSGRLTQEGTLLEDDDDVFTFDDDEENKPDAVKVAEKVLADLGASDGIDLDDFIPPHTKHTPVDKDVFNRLAEKHKREGLTGGKKDKDEPFLRFKHNKDAADSFDPELFVKKITEAADEQEKKRLAGLSSTIQHHFTAEQLLDTLNNLNPDLHDDVIVAVFKALNKPVYIGLSHDFTKPQPRKTAHMTWAFINGNLVVKE